MDPSYRIIPVLQTSNVDPGESIEIDFFIDAIGDIDSNRLHVSYAYPELFQDEIGVASIGFSMDENGRLQPGQESDQMELGRGSNQWQFPSWFFEGVSSENQDPVTLGGKTPNQEHYPQKVCEVIEAEKDHPPIKYQFNIDSDAPPGDYTITCIFTYGKSSRTYSDREDIQIHVNNRRERWEPWPFRIAVMAGGAAVLSLIQQTGIVGQVAEFLSYIG
ncbi:hypothetical protein GWG54_15130 [Natronococcus sp. JC468]|uniref:hypothetical protein n=1 Tax=Natronococcus sp. JC468 TaxID=1961921 RepID=UPI00143C7896|nr:hypothetical protein [Natronococcus sp. JC468]NKE37130.1 hypothetical protein [Natronococcus sp. JC468]